MGVNTNGAASLPNGPAMPLSYIEPHEEVEAQTLIDEQIREITGDVLHLRPCGYQIAVKIYVRPEEYKTIKRDDGTEATIYLPDQAAARDRYTSVAALVVAVGPDAYKGTHADGTPRYVSPWCKVGDWVVIPRYECFQITYRESVAVGIIADDKIMAVIKDPNDVMAANVTDRM
jgi:co-chaperonin GroES (HSP10)